MPGLALELGGGCGLLDGDASAAELGVVHLLVVHKVAAGIDDGDRDGAIVLGASAMAGAATFLAFSTEMGEP